MPHIRVEYSANMEARIDIALLCWALRDAAAATGLFPLAGIRVRALACTHAVIADGNEAHGFIDITLRLRGGRSIEDRQRAAQTVFAAAKAVCADDMARQPLALSLELRDIDPELSPKAGSIRHFLPGDAK